MFESEQQRMAPWNERDRTHCDTITCTTHTHTHEEYIHNIDTTHTSHLGYVLRIIYRYMCTQSAGLGITHRCHGGFACARRPLHEGDALGGGRQKGTLL